MDDTNLLAEQDLASGRFCLSERIEQIAQIARQFAIDRRGP